MKVGTWLLEDIFYALLIMGRHGKVRFTLRKLRVEFITMQWEGLCLPTIEERYLKVKVDAFFGWWQSWMMSLLQKHLIICFILTTRVSLGNIQRWLPAMITLYLMRHQSMKHLKAIWLHSCGRKHRRYKPASLARLMEERHSN